jgi:hypothetical protein
VGGESEDEEELGGEEDDSEEGVIAVRIGRGGGSMGREGGVSGNKRKEMSSTEKTEEEGCG